MTIEKNGKVFTVRENAKSWTVSRVIEHVTINVNVSKADCPAIESLKVFIAENNIF